MPQNNLKQLSKPKIKKNDPNRFKEEFKKMGLGSWDFLTPYERKRVVMAAFLAEFTESCKRGRNFDCDKMNPKKKEEIDKAGAVAAKKRLRRIIKAKKEYESALHEI